MKDALKLALEVLELPSFKTKSMLRQQHKAITAIKEALAQDELCSSQEPVMEDSEQYRLQMAAISTAAIGYWKEGDGIRPEYDTLALRDVAKLYVKYDALYNALKLALEALEQLDGIDTETECVTIDVGNVITAINEALSQDELCSSQEPVMVLTDAGQDANMSWPLGPKGKGKMLLNNLKPAQPEQEPVGRISADCEGILRQEVMLYTDKPLKIGTAVYTTPPKRPWVGLTPEEIDTIYRNIPPPVEHWKLSRAIEAQLKELNQ